MKNSTTSILARVRNVAADQRGAVSVEYIILAGVVALTIIGGFSAFGKAVDGKINEQAGSVGQIPGN